MAIELEGPARRFLERQATYQVSLANVGSAEATIVEIFDYLDRGFSFVGTEYQGQYDPTRHAVYWSLAELPLSSTIKIVMVSFRGFSRLTASSRVRIWEVVYSLLRSGWPGSIE
jgi:hypothetical protein